MVMQSLPPDKTNDPGLERPWIRGLVDSEISNVPTSYFRFWNLPPDQKCRDIEELALFLAFSESRGVEKHYSI